MVAGMKKGYDRSGYDEVSIGEDDEEEEEEGEEGLQNGKKIKLNVDDVDEMSCWKASNKNNNNNNNNKIEKSSHKHNNHYNDFLYEICDLKKNENDENQYGLPYYYNNHSGNSDSKQRVATTSKPDSGIINTNASDISIHRHDDRLHEG